MAARSQAPGAACTLPTEQDLNDVHADSSAFDSLAIVVGAGIMGLTTALQVRRRFPRTRVVIVTEQWLDGSTSRGSGGYWEPYQIAGTPDELINRWGQATFDHLTQLHQSPEAPQAGVQLVACHALYTSAEAPEPPAWAHIVHSFRTLDSAALKRLGLHEEFKSGWGFESLVADQSYYLSWIENQLQACGGVSVVFKRVLDLGDVATAGVNVIFNCTGMGAQDLMDDPDCFPIRGQVRRIVAPWMKGCWFFNNSYYLIPQLDCVVVGGTQQPGNYNTEVSSEDSERIWSFATSAMPGLKGAKVVKEWAGLRPARSSGVRLEAEELAIGVGAGSASVQVVHNYGHGGSGITLHWGCVQDAVEIAAAKLSSTQDARTGSVVSKL